MTIKSRINTGDRIGSQLRGPEWTPYAQAIAENYPVQLPWFYTLPSNLEEGVVFQDRATIITAPQKHDVLLFGAYAILRDDNGFGDEGNFILLQIIHEETGIPWAAPNIINAATLPAVAGVFNPVAFPNQPNRTTVLKLPEAFFLPRGHRLRFEWSQSILDSGTSVDALLTLVGVALIGGNPPREIPMPDGSIAALGSRIPWFCTLVMGIPFRDDQWVDWVFTDDRQDIQFVPPDDCEIELHDSYFNSTFFLPSRAGRLVTKLIDMGEASTWTPLWTPINAWTGDERAVNPTKPFVMPIILRPGHRLALVEQQNDDNFQFLWAMVTFRGVRRCLHL